jgi:hypothetical protein
MNDNPEDDLADVLAPQQGVPSPELREAVLRLTERQLMRARLWHRATKSALVVMTLLVGGVVGWIVRPVPEPVQLPAPVPTPELIVVHVVVPVPVPQPPPSHSTGVVALSASEAELRAEQTDDRTEAAKLYRTAGDGFLRNEDYANATRCYRLFLSRAGDGGLSPESNDSWLLTSLKNAAFKEKTNAQKTVD